MFYKCIIPIRGCCCWSLCFAKALTHQQLLMPLFLAHCSATRAHGLWIYVMLLHSMSFLHHCLPGHLKDTGCFICHHSAFFCQRRGRPTSEKQKGFVSHRNGCSARGCATV